MQCIAVHCNAVHCSALQCTTLSPPPMGRYLIKLQGAAAPDIVCSAHCTLQCSTVQHSVVQCSTVQCRKRSALNCRVKKSTCRLANVQFTLRLLVQELAGQVLGTIPPYCSKYKNTFTLYPICSIHEE